ncbi:TPA: single-stranded DNA-binding protein, partial [Staphylococcus aureus]|nr:single-stranded DNA-binding protein [Staphylococcus aureus]HEI4286570.1 single-stranded DNA-binding protein [Staphylococcus aureus]
KITGQAQFTKETNQEKFYNGSAGFQAGEFTVKVKNIEFNDRENRYFTIVFENDEGKQYKHNQFVPPYKYDFQEKQLIELVTRLGIKLNLPSLDFDTNDLIGKFCHLVLKWKFNEDEGKYFT